MPITLNKEQHLECNTYNDIIHSNAHYPCNYSLSDIILIWMDILSKRLSFDLKQCHTDATELIIETKM